MKFSLSQITLGIFAPIMVFGTMLMATTAVSANPDGVEEAPMQFEEGKKRMHKRMGDHMEKSVKKHLEQIDTNQDGNVDLNEYLTNAEQRFNEMDVNGDQVVTGDEAREHHKSMRKKHSVERKKHMQERKKNHKEMREKYKAEQESASDDSND